MSTLTQDLKCPTPNCQEILLESGDEELICGEKLLCETCDIEWQVVGIDPIELKNVDDLEDGEISDNIEDEDEEDDEDLEVDDEDLGDDEEES